MNDAVAFRGSARAQRLRGEPIEAGYSRQWDHALIRCFVTRFTSEMRFLRRAHPSGAYTPIAGGKRALARYIGISQSVGCGPSGGFRFLG